jgi:hypothetical protein
MVNNLDSNCRECRDQIDRVLAALQRTVELVGANTFTTLVFFCKKLVVYPLFICYLSGCDSLRKGNLEDRLEHSRLFRLEAPSFSAVDSGRYQNGVAADRFREDTRSLSLTVEWFL